MESECITNSVSKWHCQQPQRHKDTKETRVNKPLFARFLCTVGAVYDRAVTDRAYSSRQKLLTQPKAIDRSIVCADVHASICHGQSAPMIKRRHLVAAGPQFFARLAIQ